MIELSTLAMTAKVNNINLFLLKNTNTAEKLIKKFHNSKKVKVYEFSYLEKILFKMGIIKSKFYKKIFSSDVIFIHNANLAKPLRKIFNEKLLILFFHTDKQKQIKKLTYVNRVFTVNSYTKDIINKIYKNKATLLANCLEIKNKKKLSKIKSNKLVVGAMGRLVKKKGFDKLIEIFKQLENIHLIIAGDGPLMKSYRDLVKGQNK